MRDSTEQQYRKLLKDVSKGEEIDADRLQKIEGDRDKFSQLLKHMESIRGRLDTTDQDIIDKGRAIMEKLVKERKSKEE